MLHLKLYYENIEKGGELLMAAASGISDTSCEIGMKYGKPISLDLLYFVQSSQLASEIPLAGGRRMKPSMVCIFQ